MQHIIEAAPRGNAGARAQVKFITSAEEADLAERNSRGDISARNELVTSHLPLVNKLAKPYQRPGVEWDDLVSEGKLGLFRAAQTFNPNKGARFTTYATWWVRAAITQYIERSKSVVRQAYRSTKVDDSLNAQVFREEDGKTAELIDQLADETQADAWEQIASKRNAEELKELALAPLSERERFVVEARHLGDEPQTLSEIGAQLGISRERARQIEATAMRKARQVVEPALDRVERRGRWVNRSGRRDHDVERFLADYYRYCTRRAKKARGK